MPAPPIDPLSDRITRYIWGFDTPDRRSRAIPDPVEDAPFNYCVRDNRAGDPVGVFSVNGIVQATRQDLERFFASKGRKGQKYTKKEWYTAQLDFYGVPHEKGARNADLEKLLKTAFRDGKVSDSDGGSIL